MKFSLGRAVIQNMKTAQELVSDLQRLFEGANLLEEIYAHLDPYDNPLPKDIDQKLKDYFGFDDSE